MSEADKVKAIELVARQRDVLADFVVDLIGYRDAHVSDRAAAVLVASSALNKELATLLRSFDP